MREEFEKAFEKQFSDEMPQNWKSDIVWAHVFQNATWAAKWAMERSAVECEKEAEETGNNYEPRDCAKRIRQLMKEIDE